MKIAELFNIQGRFLRSAQLERDFYDPTSLQGYVVSRHIQSNLDRISNGLDKNSGQRAWRITGDYGSGKSSFALLLAQLMAGRDGDMPSQLRRSLDLSKLKRNNRPRYLPVLISGSREPLATALIRSLGRALETVFDRRSKLPMLERIKQSLTTGQISDLAAVQMIVEANSEIIAKGKAEGLLIILDELGKFLEFAALHPERQDVLLLQNLAEAATRSAREPIFVVGLLHQGFSAYADLLSQSAQREWEKVAGRFEELVFDQPLDQIVRLIGSALNISQKHFPRWLEGRAKPAMRKAVELGWYGAAASTSLSQEAPTLYPLHPSVVPILVRLFSRFGQNERSLFSFLLSNEPFGLQTFSQRNASPETFYRIFDLYDYAASNFGHRLSVQSYRNHWNHIDSLVRSFRSSNDIEISILKTVGLLNLINSPELLATEDSLIWAISDGSTNSEREIRNAIQRLHKQARVLYSRGRSGGYCLWSHTSVNLDAAYDEAGRAVVQNQRITTRIKEYLDARPIVARRHYIQTGNLRHFEVVYCNLVELGEAAKAPGDHADGRIVIPLCETRQEVEAATAFAREFQGVPEVLIGLTEPLSNLEKLIREVDRWSWVEKNTPELKDDRYAAEEVTRQLSAVTQTLERRVQHYAGLRQSTGSGAASMSWFHNGARRTVRSGKEFLSLISDLCDGLYSAAPRIHNELVNRRFLSSAAASARMRLIERMFISKDQPFLGMDSAKKPPEMSIYLSVLRESKVHVENNGTFSLVQPVPGVLTDPCNLQPGLSCIVNILESTPDNRFNVEGILERLREKPYGIRDGILPILLTLVLLQHQQEIALYENGTFINQVGKEELLRLTKAPQTFELQFCKIRGVRLELFEKLFEVLNPQRSPQSKTEILDIVRPICVFVSELPYYTRTTSGLSEPARKVRDVILNAREPGSLLFTELPKVLGFRPFAAEDGSKIDRNSIHEFVAVLKASLDELRMAYQCLKDRIRQQVFDLFQPKVPTSTFQALRDSLGERAESLLLDVKDMELKAFCFRIMDNHLPESDWLDSVGSYVANTAPSRWKDEDEQTFKIRFQDLGQKFLRVESINFSGKQKLTSQAAIRVALTTRDGSERQQVVHLTNDEDKAAKALEDHFRSLLPKNPRVSIAAMSRMTWKLMENTND